jgi:CheY-like chemotaxis protein
MATLLQMEGQDAHVAFDGPDAIRQVATLNPDLMLLDVSMPGMDGPDVVRVVRKMELPAQPVIAAVSGYATHYHKRLCAEAGFDHYLLKPVEPPALDHLLSIVAEGRVLRDTAGILQHEHRAAAYAFAMSQMEFEDVLLDAAEKMDEQSRKRSLEKIRWQQKRTAKWLDQETVCSPEQKAKLRTLLRVLRDRAAKMRLPAEHARFGPFDELEHLAANLMVRGYTQTDRYEQRGPKQYFLGPEHPSAPDEKFYVLVWHEDGPLETF